MLRSDGVLAVERWRMGLDGEDAVATQVWANSYMRFNLLPCIDYMLVTRINYMQQQM